MSALADRFRLSLQRRPGGQLISGDAIDDDSPALPAAVLVAVTDRAEPGLILTVRTGHLRTHAGQIAFPGGRVDEGEDAIVAALREAWEELELDPSVAEVVATLDPYRTISNYSVTPVLAVIPPDLPLRPHEHEVDDWFEAPLAHVIDPVRQVRHSDYYQGRQRDYFEIMWGTRRIWGATAAMIVNLSRRLQWT